MSSILPSLTQNKPCDALASISIEGPGGPLPRSAQILANRVDQAAGSNIPKVVEVKPVAAPPVVSPQGAGAGAGEGASQLSQMPSVIQKTNWETILDNIKQNIKTSLEKEEHDDESRAIYKEALQTASEIWRAEQECMGFKFGLFVKDELIDRFKGRIHWIGFELRAGADYYKSANERWKQLQPQIPRLRDINSTLEKAQIIHNDLYKLIPSGKHVLKHVVAGLQGKIHEADFAKTLGQAETLAKQALKHAKDTRDPVLAIDNPRSKVITIYNDLCALIKSGKPALIHETKKLNYMITEADEAWTLQDATTLTKKALTYAESLRKDG